jgi:hypothetical protein
MQYEKYTNEDGYFGWGRPDQTHQERLDMARENFDMVSARESRIVDFKTGDPTTQKFMCWYASRKLFGKDILHVYQQTGSCVGASAGNLLNYTQCVEIAIKGDFEEFKYVFFPYAYGIARQIDGSRSQGDGSNGSSIAEAILKEGSIPEDIQGLPKATKSDTDWYLNKTIEYAWSGPSRGKWLYTDFEGEGKKHTIKSAARVTSFDEAAIQSRELGGKTPSPTLCRQDTPVIVVDIEADNGVEVVEDAQKPHEHVPYRRRHRRLRVADAMHSGR